MFATNMFQSCLDVSETLVRFGVNSFLQSTLVIAAGLIVARLLRSKGAAIQSAVYRATLAAALACPCVSLLLSAVETPTLRFDLDILSARSSAPASETASAPVHNESPDTSLAAISPRDAERDYRESADRRDPSPAVMPSTTATSTADIDAGPQSPAIASSLRTASSLPWRSLAIGALSTAWLLGTCLLSIRLLLGYRLAASLRQTALPTDGQTISLCLTLAERLGVRAPSVLQTPFASSPLLMGVLRPVILLPEQTGDAPSREILVHELAHLIRRDPAWNALGRLGTALWFFQPLMWLLVRRMVVAAEEVCDDYVLHLGSDRPGYARQLVDIAQQYCPAPAIGVGVISPRSWVGRRVVRILDPSRQLSMHTSRRAVAVAVAAFLAATILVGLIGIGRQQAIASPADTSTSSDDPSPTPPSTPASKNARQIIVRGKVLSPDGQPLPGATVRAGVDHWAMLDSIASHDDKLPVSETKTDANGDFTISFTTQPYGDLSRLDRRWQDIWKQTNIAASAPGYGAAWVTYKDIQPDRPITLQLVPDVPVKGRVVDTAGKPVAGLEITVAKDNVEAAKDENLAPWIAGIKEGQLPWVVVNLSPREIEPAIIGVPEQVTTDAEGRFEIRGVGRDRHLDLRFKGESVSHRIIEVVTRNMEPIERVIIGSGYDRPDPAKQPVFGAEFTVTAKPSRPIVGVVRDAKTKKPLAGVSVESDKLADYPFVNHRVLKTTTDAEGRYRLIGMPKGKDNRLMILPNDDQPYLMREVKVPDTEGLGPITVDVDLHRGVWITGRVTEKTTGRPVRARLYYLPFRSNAFAKATPEFGENFNADGDQSRYESRGDGSYRLVGLPGRAIVGAESVLREYRFGVGVDTIQAPLKEKHFDTYANPVHPGPSWPNVMKEINPSADTESVTVDFEVDPGRSMRVTMLGPDGKPISGVGVNGAASSHGCAQTIDEPTFEVMNLAPGETRRLVFRDEKRKLGLVTHIKADDPQPQPIVIQLQPAGTLKGRLLSPDGNPAAGTSVEAIVLPSGDFGQELPRVTTDAQGRFQYMLLPGANYSLRVEGGTMRVKLVDQVDFVEGDLSVKPNQVKDLGDVTLGLRAEPKAKKPAEPEKPKRLVAPAIDAKAAAAEAIRLFDTNNDGKISGAELDKCPGLKAAINQVDPTGKSEITAEMIAVRIKAWQDSKIARMSLACRVTHNGQPLVGAKVAFVPEKFLGPNVKTATGKTDANGYALLSIPTNPTPGNFDPPGVAPGFYRVEITKDGEPIPAKYNTETMFGQEAAHDAKGIIDMKGIKYDLKY
jgi:beta-lactamase regulating signal transducer with metallopeptidase domain